MNPDQLRAEEQKIAELWNAGEVSAMTHLSGGNEEWLCDFWNKNIRPTDWVLASHRAHYHYLLHGHADLAERVKAGRSMFLYGKRFVNSAIVAGVASIAAGLAYSIKRRGGTERVWCFVGDGAEDHGHFYEAVRAVHGGDLPCTFIIEDNDSSCGVSKEARGVKPMQWPSCVVRCRYTMTWPHTGTGVRPNLKKQ